MYSWHRQLTLDMERGELSLESTDDPPDVLFMTARTDVDRGGAGGGGASPLSRALLGLELGVPL